MKKLSQILNYFVFLATTVAIAAVFYEGMALKWFDVVSVFIITMDFSFIVSTIVNLFVERKTTWRYINVLSLLLIIVAVIMRVCEITYPIWTLVFWYFYIWFTYGIRITRGKQ